MTYLRVSQPLTYIDIFQEAYSLANSSTCNLFCARLDVRVLAWTSHHEHAVFHLLQEIHPATVCVWFQYFRGEGDSLVDTIHKILPRDGKWKKAEVSVGRIPFVNNNPFDPRKDNAASNTAESVFPQNQARDIRDAELLRLYRLTLHRNEKGRFDQRLEKIIAEIKRRNAANLTMCNAFVHIEAHL